MKKLLAFFLLLLYAPLAFTCSTFLLAKNGQYVFGRNYDWVSGNGILVVNARGVQKTSFVAEGEKSISWTAKCGSVTFNQFGKEFPHGGINEKGLVVELMWLDETTYPKKDARGALSELQWIQYQLDNFATVEEVIASNNTVRISDEDAVPLHYLVADAAGNAATIEFINGQLVAHRGANLKFPVLTNTKYADALQEVTAGKNSSYSNNSVERFATACSMVQQFQQAPAAVMPVDYAFTILDKIAQGDFTKWKIVYDITAREIHFSTAGKRKRLSLGDLDFSCSRPPLFIDINANAEGVVTNNLATLTSDKNKKALQRSADESKSQVRISEASVNKAAAYFTSTVCSK